MSIRGLRVRRGAVQVFDGLDLELRPGRITGLLGPSGCGKTTLIRCIVGIQKVQAGSVTVLGRPAGQAELRHRVSYASQQVAVYLDLSVLENLRYFAALLGVDRAGVTAVLDEVGLDAQRDQRAGQLSGGQLRRASLAVALLGDPELIVLDEPTVGLDPLLRADLWRLFRRSVERGRTVLISSHVLEEANRCDDLVLMRQGRVIAQLSPAELLASTGRSDPEQAFTELIQRDAQRSGEAR